MSPVASLASTLFFLPGSCKSLRSRLVVQKKYSRQVELEQIHNHNFVCVPTPHHLPLLPKQNGPLVIQGAQHTLLQFSLLASPPRSLCPGCGPTYSTCPQQKEGHNFQPSNLSIYFRAGCIGWMMEDDGCINKVNQARTPHSYCANVFDPNTDPRRFCCRSFHC